MNVSNKDINNFQEMLESFKHLNEKFHGEMRSGYMYNIYMERSIRKWVLWILLYNIKFKSIYLPKY